MADEGEDERGGVPQKIQLEVTTQPIALAPGDSTGKHLSPATKFRASLAQLVSGVVAIVLVTFAIVGVYFSLNAHAHDRDMHLDPDLVRQRGMPVLREDLRQAKDEILKTVDDGQRKILEAVQQRDVRLRGCHPGPGGSMTCRIAPDGE